MSNNSGTALSIGFGIVGILSVIVGILGWHRKDALATQFFRREDSGAELRQQEEGHASPGNNGDDQRGQFRTRTDQSQPSSDLCPIAPSLPETTFSDSSSPCCNYAGLIVATGLVEPSGPVAAAKLVEPSSPVEATEPVESCSPVVVTQWVESTAGLQSMSRHMDDGETQIVSSNV